MSDEMNNISTAGGSVSYGRGVLVLPRAAAEKFRTATKKDILALLFRLACDQGWGADAAAAAFGHSAEDAESELAFWRGAGIITSAELDDVAAAAPAAESHGKKKKRPDASLPAYTTEELTQILERRAESTAIIDECERMLGKMFSTAETSKILGLIDYLELDGEYIIDLCAHCARIGKKSLRYVERVAFDLYDRGITEVEALDRHLRTVEMASQLEGRIRSMFGINPDRALTARERGFIDSWVGKFGYGMDEIGRAYELTVNAIGKESLPYANAILETWNTAGLRTIGDIDAYLTAQKAENAAASAVPDGTSFNTDAFFEAALRRSYGDAAVPEASAPAPSVTVAVDSANTNTNTNANGGRRR